MSYAKDPGLSGGKLFALSATSVALLVMFVTPALPQYGNTCDLSDLEEKGACLQERLREQEAALTTAYASARTRAQELDATQSDDLKRASRALYSSQRGWTSYRNRHCELITFEARKRTAESELISICLIEMTRTRVKELGLFVGTDTQ